jgi:hypothetical protein
MILNALKASGAPKGVIAQANHYVKKIRGQRIIAIDPNEENANHISVCQLTFVDKLEHYTILVNIVATEPLYEPIPEHLKVPALNERADRMNEANTLADISQAELDSYRRERNKCFNEETVGLVDRYLTAKDSAKAVYGVTSAEFKTIKGLAFRRIVG